MDYDKKKQTGGNANCQASYINNGKGFIFAHSAETGFEEIGDHGVLIYVVWIMTFLSQGLLFKNCDEL